MVWAAFSARGKSPICFVPSRMNAQPYIDLLDSELIPFAKDFHGVNWIFQQDNAPIHVARATNGFFQSRNIPLLQWPALSPYLNPIEDLWGILSARIFGASKQYDTLKQLKQAHSKGVGKN